MKQAIQTIKRAVKSGTAEVDGIAIVYRSNRKSDADKFARAIEATGGEVWSRSDYWMPKFGIKGNALLHIFEVKGDANDEDGLPLAM